MCDALQVIKCLPTSQGCPDTQLWQKYRAGISAKLAGMDSTKCNRVMIWCLNPGQLGLPYACVRYSHIGKEVFKRDDESRKVNGEYSM